MQIRNSLTSQPSFRFGESESLRVTFIFRCVLCVRWFTVLTVSLFSVTFVEVVVDDH